jgi:hypothetical protein
MVVYVVILKNNPFNEAGTERHLLFLSHSAFHSSFQKIPGTVGVLVFTG